MPKVIVKGKVKKFPYTKKGKMAAKRHEKMEGKKERMMEYGKKKKR